MLRRAEGLTGSFKYLAKPPSPSGGGTSHIHAMSVPGITGRGNGDCVIALQGCKLGVPEGNAALAMGFYIFDGGRREKAGAHARGLIDFLRLKGKIQIGDQECQKYQMSHR